MKNLIIRISFIGGVLLFFQTGFAQQDPLYTQYMYNMSVINPAYAIEEEGLVRLGAIYRSQWAGMDGAPKTVTAFAHTALSPRVELGLNIVHDEIGDIIKENNITADLAYVIPINEAGTKLSFGAKGGLTTFDGDLSRLQLDNMNDPAFENINEVFPVFGVGFYLFSENYYLGLSAPNLFTSKHLENEQGMRVLGEENIHYFLTGGYAFDLSENFRIKPAFMARAVEGAPVSVDVTANFLMYERLEIGVGYRFDESITGLVNFVVTEGLRIGYAYDYTTSSLGDYNDGSHEILLLFDLKLNSSDGRYENRRRFF
jgi:type IX secretion system PorP/SprF family membrane protein